MPLNYPLFRSPITTDPDSRVARALVKRTYTLDDIFAKMTSRGSTVTKAEGLAVFEELSQAIEQLVQEGNAVTTPLFTIAPSITGVFSDDEDTFDSGRHQVKLRINPGLRLKAIQQHIEVRKVMSEKILPCPKHYYNVADETQDHILTSGGAARITGKHLKVDETAPEQGIFFINLANGKTTKVKGKLLCNKLSELIFINPVLPPGIYRLEVRALIRNNKAMSTGVLSNKLTVKKKL